MSNIFKFRISPDAPWQTLPVIKGQDGEPGKDGPQGPAGKDGKTPVKGVDYFTEADIQEIVDKVPKVDLSEYAKKSEIPDTSGFTTMTAVEAKGYQTADQVNALINAALGVIENGSY